MRLQLAAVLTGAFLALAACSPAQAPCSAKTVQPSIRVMPLGDSITAGVGSSTGAGYRGPLQELLGQGFDFVGSHHDGPIRDPDHEGHSGYTIDQVRKGIDDWMAQARPDVALLHLGINDLDRGFTAGASLRLVALVDRIRADRPGVGVFVQGLIPTTAGLQDQARALNADVRQVADSHGFTWVEPPALTADGMADRLHPNDEGYKQMAQGFYAALPPGVRNVPPPGCSM